MIKGLSSNEVEESKKINGSNKMPSFKKRTILDLIIESFSDPIIKILLIALAIKILFLFKDANWYETLGILIAIFLATFISTISEYGSESSFNKLNEENKEVLVKAYRDGNITLIKSSDVVVNDLIYLESGDIVPSDGKIITGSVQIDESMLTGESRLVEKEKNGLLYKGTIIYNGECEYQVTKVGIDTEYGLILKEINNKKNISPLKLRLLKLSKIINKIGYIGSFLVTFSYLFSKIVIANNFDYNEILLYVKSKSIINDLIYSLTLCVTTIVVAVPEGLPMMITLVLSCNMKKLIKDKVLVRKMVGIETAGNINYLLTDKTGTITYGKLKVTSILTPDLCMYSDLEKLNGTYKEVVLESLFYNSSSKYNNNEIIGGNETDKAILEFIKNINAVKNKRFKYIPFDSDKKYSEVVIENKRYIKGAYDILLKKCNYVMDHLGNIKGINYNTINKFVNRYTKEGYRVLGNVLNKDNNYILINFILIKDKIRNESKEGVRLLTNAGIKIIMVTGDHLDTAISVGKEIGLLNSSDDICMSSDEFNKLSIDKLHAILPKLKILSRALPKDKSKLVKILQDKNNVVGMTGDGVNDAPALKKADVSYAMGSGTSVAKEASDIIILDNNLLSISKSVLYGRTIFKSMRKFIAYQLTVNFCALTLSIFGPLIGVSAPITIVQMLWLNMIMDTFAALAFSFEPPLKKYFNEKPISLKENIIDGYMYYEILISGLYSALLCISFLKLNVFKNIIGYNTKYFMTAYFALFIFLGIFNAFSSRTKSINIFKNIRKNKMFIFIFSLITLCQILIIYFGGSIFATYGLKIKDLIIVILLGSSSLFVNTIRKIVYKKKTNLK